MSGIESDQHFKACLDAGVENMLTSFLYLEKKGDLDIVKKRKQQYPELNFMIDSGAHTFQTNCHDKYKHWTLTDYLNYLERYTDWLLKNKAYIASGVELDIEYPLNMLMAKGNPKSPIGPNMVQSWRKDFFRPLEEAGVPICYVWKPEHGLDVFEQMCSDYGYVGLPGEFSSDPSFNKYMTVAQRYTTKVHGFAATKQADFRDWPWFSVDSITWKTSEIYGVLIHWDSQAQKLTFIDDKSERINYRKDFEAAGFDADAIIQDKDYKEVTRYALYSMRRMEAFYQDLYQDRTRYYERRLPHPKYCQKMSNKEVSDWWAVLEPTEKFPKYAAETDLLKLRAFLIGISAVQYKEASFIVGDTEHFMRSHFDELMQQGVPPDVFQKELANYLAPSNPAALRRIDPSHYKAENNPPKQRKPIDLDLSALEHSNEIIFDV